MADGCKHGNSTERFCAQCEPGQLRVALATALADRDAHVRGYEDLEQRHAAVVAERDQMLRERNEARAESKRASDFSTEELKAAIAGRNSRDLEAATTERDALRAEVERLRNENQTAWNKASVLDEDLRHLRAAIEPTEANLTAYTVVIDRAFSNQDWQSWDDCKVSEVRAALAAVLAAIAARAGKP